MQGSAEVMKNINSCINIKEINKAMMDMQREMEKMGMVGEMIEDAMDNMDDNVDIDNE